MNSNKEAKQRVSSGSPLENSIGFSRAVRAGNLIAVSGTAPLTDRGDTFGLGDPYMQTKRCLEISILAIEKLGGKKEDIIRTRIMLTNMIHWQAAAKAHGEIFRDIKPACTFVEVNGFIDKYWLVETEVDCVVSDT